MIQQHFLLVLLLIFGLQSGAQTQTMEGTIFESGTRIRLLDVSVRNLRTRQLVKSDSAGRFMIEAKTGDIVAFTSFTYMTDTLLVTGLKNQEIFLLPKTIELAEVSVEHVKMSLGNLRDPDFHGQTVVYQRDEDGFYKGGIAFRLSYWNKDSKKVRRSRERLRKAETLTQIDSLFTPLNIGKYIPLKGQELNDFVYLYRPSAIVYKDPQFNLALYLNECYKKFKDLPPGERRLSSLTE